MCHRQATFVWNVEGSRRAPKSIRTHALHGVPCATAGNTHASTLSRNTHMRSGARSGNVHQCNISSRYVYMLSYAARSNASRTHQTHIHARPQRLFLHKREALQSASSPSTHFLRNTSPRSTNMCVGAPTHTYALLEHIHFGKLNTASRYCMHVTRRGARYALH